MSSEIILSQDLLDSVLSDISVEEQLVASLGKILNVIDVILQSNLSKELLFLKRDIKSLIEKTGSVSSDDEKLYVLNSFQKIYSDIIVMINSDSLYKALNMTRNLFQLWSNNLKSDKRGNYRVPVAIETVLNCYHDSVDVYIMNISSSGTCLLSSKALTVGKTYYMCIKSVQLSKVALKPKRIESFDSSEKYIQMAGCSFNEPLNSDDLRSIVVYSYSGLEDK